MSIDISVIWFFIIIFSIMMYVVLDGFDLGIGVLFLINKNETDRDTMMNTISPVWDGNETWIVLSSAALFGAFPLAYSVILDAMSIPLTIMLLGLIFRGVSFEFRFNSPEKHRHLWSKGFFFGSLIAAFSQGLLIGSMLNGLEVTGREYSGNELAWLSPFPIFCGFGVIVVYMLLGCSWLILKTNGSIHRMMSKVSVPLTLLLLVVFVIISIWTPLKHPYVFDRWFTSPNLFFLLPIPVLFIICCWGIIHKSMEIKENKEPFLLTLIVVLLGFAGLGVSFWPNIIPNSISIWQASSPAQSQGFMLVGGVIVIPAVFAYSMWSYYAFKGKVEDN